MNLIRLCVVLILFSTVVFASKESADHEHEKKAKGRFGSHLAVTDFNEEDGFKLSPLSLNTLGIKFKKLEKDGPWSVPSSAIVKIKHSTAVYRRIDGWTSLVLVRVVYKDGKKYKIRSVDLQANDEVATQGTQFLRLTELDLNSDTVDSCSH